MRAFGMKVTEGPHGSHDKQIIYLRTKNLVYLEIKALQNL